MCEKERHLVKSKEIFGQVAMRERERERELGDGEGQGRCGIEKVWVWGGVDREMERKGQLCTVVIEIFRHFAWGSDTHLNT